MIGSIGGLVLLTLVVGSVVMYRTRHKRKCLIIVLGGISLLIIQICTLKNSGNYHIFCFVGVGLVSQKNSCRKLCKYKSIWRIFLRSVSFIICSMCHDSYLISQERARGSREERKYRQSGYLAP